MFKTAKSNNYGLDIRIRSLSLHDLPAYSFGLLYFNLVGFETCMYRFSDFPLHEGSGILSIFSSNDLEYSHVHKDDEAVRDAIRSLLHKDLTVRLYFGNTKGNIEIFATGVYRTESQKAMALEMTKTTDTTPSILLRQPVLSSALKLIHSMRVNMALTHIKGAGTLAGSLVVDIAVYRLSRHNSSRSSRPEKKAMSTATVSSDSLPDFEYVPMRRAASPGPNMRDADPSQSPSQSPSDTPHSFSSYDFEEDSLQPPPLVVEPKRATSTRRHTSVVEVEVGVHGCTDPCSQKVRQLRAFTDPATSNTMDTDKMQVEQRPAPVVMRFGRGRDSNRSDEPVFSRSASLNLRMHQTTLPRRSNNNDSQGYLQALEPEPEVGLVESVHLDSALEGPHRMSTEQSNNSERRSQGADAGAVEGRGRGSRKPVLVSASASASASSGSASVARGVKTKIGGSSNGGRGAGHHAGAGGGMRYKQPRKPPIPKNEPVRREPRKPQTQEESSQSRGDPQPQTQTQTHTAFHPPGVSLAEDEGSGLGGYQDLLSPPPPKRSSVRLLQAANLQEPASAP